MGNDYFRKRAVRYWNDSVAEVKRANSFNLELCRRDIEIKGARILDVGCGNAYFGIELARAGARVTALDISPERMETVKELVAEAGVEIELVVADALKTPFDDDTFDMILCKNVVEHIENPLGLMVEMKRILRPGGGIRLTAPNRYSITQILRDEHYGLPLVIAMPRWLASFIVCRLLNIEETYSVSVVPSYRLIRHWMDSCGFKVRMDLPDGGLIRRKISDPGTVNRRSVRMLVRVMGLLGLGRIIGRLADSERFLGTFAERWSFWLTKPLDEGE